MIPTQLTLSALQDFARDVYAKLNPLQVGNIDLSGRRVIGAGRAIGKFDYVTLFDLEELVNGTTAVHVTEQGGGTALSQVRSVRVGPYATQGSPIAHAGELFAASDRSFISWMANGGAWNWHAGIHRDVAANRPTPVATDTGYLFYATDTQEMSRWNGSAWLNDIVFNTAALTANALLLGAGTAKAAPMASLGTTTTLLHGNAAGAPTFAAVSLTADVTGTLPIANGGTGSATGFTYGSWTPTLSFGGGATGLTYAVQNGYYERRTTSAGSFVTAIGSIQLSAKGTSTGSAVLDGLPVALQNAANQLAPATVYAGNLSGIAGQLQGYGNVNETKIYLNYLGTGTAADLADTHFANNTFLMVAIHYKVA